MEKADIKINETYLVKVASNLVPVKVTRKHDNGGWEGISVKTGKTIRIKSPQRLRRCLAPATTEARKPQEANENTIAAKERDTGERSATGGKGDGKPMSLLDAAAHLLSLDTSAPMNCQTIVNVVITQGLWKPRNGKTPANTLYAAILREIKKKGETSRFVKTERGKFALASKA